MKGIIALDIDGTITAEFHTMPEPMVRYLGSLAKEGWQFIFITGRTFYWSHRLLSALDFPYHVAVQNGAIILEMPSRKIVGKKYLDKSILPMMQEICETEPTDFVIYTGYENDDICYYRPHHFSEELRRYLKERIQELSEKWVEVNSFERLNMDGFASVKCFGKEESAIRIAYEIERKLGLHVPLITDPFNSSIYVIQATHAEVNKGQALIDFKKKMMPHGVVIAAGDDNNDRMMLAEADVKIVMSTAPKDIQAMADIIAPPASQMGLIEGLNQAIYK